VPIWGPFALILLGTGAIWLELFIPAFGIIGIGGVAIIVTAVVQGYQHLSAELALVVLLTALTVPPVFLVFLLRRFSRSFLGKRLINTTTLGEPVVLLETGTPGVALSALRPSGYADIEGTRRNVVTNGEYVDSGTSIVVVSDNGARIVVRPQGGSEHV
jgi:membrane-bound serine protease (ClpP class)